ncbi:DUF3822 family protein [Draconibacterium sp. IB214405]|uniref:DUF3822 family protein n=1 Tax=Draconibacterium sp. IB214405 TaxID=3097352 RepID=UPI002A129C4C|nr:DUF3822 family protein [Draconibacterium sp. IB214405]MDX8339163.1 DUF3822 family protein [Draconibacterium sp. IB214405]
MHEFVDETFQLDSSGEKILSIQASLNGFSFSIICPDQNKLLYFKSTELKISTENLMSRHFESWFAEEAVLQNNFKKVVLFYHSGNLTLVPDHLFDSDSKNELPTLLFDNNENLSWVNNSVGQINAHLLFTIPEAFQQTINKYFPTAQITHPLKPLIAKNEDSGAGQNLMLLFGTNHFSVALSNDNKLEMVNHFSFKHPNDVVYFILTILRQFKLAPGNIQTFYAGDMDAHNGLEDLLKKHFPNSAEIQANIATPPFLDKLLITKNISLFL